MASPADKSGLGEIAAVVLAAGRSTRMGQPKMALPWGATTVLGQVVLELAKGGVDRILVVTGGDRETVEGILRILSLPPGVALSTIYNPDYAQGEMLSSLQTGLRAAGEGARAALVVLGDQPQIEAKVVGAILQAYAQSCPLLVVPSIHHRRGHPWLVDRSLWDEILAMSTSQTLRDFLQSHLGLIQYVEVDTESILMDLDSPQDYQRAQGRGQMGRASKA